MDTIPEYYPDSDDTYLIIDSLDQDASFIRSRFNEDSVFSVEVGPGGGLVSKSFVELSRKNNISGIHFAIDINRHAAEATSGQFQSPGACEVVIGDMFSGFRPEQRFDIIFCNPPYVPSSPINRARDIRASYAGGERGREFIDAFLPEVSERLTSRGVFYLLLEHRNNIAEVLDVAEQQYALESTYIRDRKIRGEHLYVYRFTKRSLVPS